MLPVSAVTVFCLTERKFLRSLFKDSDDEEEFTGFTGNLNDYEMDDSDDAQG